jgi:tetrahydromethanopterin S-methyltransferase subunit H
MTWNIRVVKYQEEGESLLALAEVFYNTQGKPCGYSMVSAIGESIDELHTYVDWMKEALAYPIIEFDVA